MDAQQQQRRQQPAAPAPVAAPREKNELRRYWKNAYTQYDASLKEAEAEYARKNNHFWNRHKIKKYEQSPTMNSAAEFEAELKKRQRMLKDARLKNHTIFGTLGSLAKPVEIIGGQASAIVGQIFPATPAIFGAVIYLFQAGSQVSDSFDTLEKLFKECDNAIVQVNSLVEGVRELSQVLQDHVITTLVAILDVFKKALKFATEGRLKAYRKALMGTGGPEKDSLENMRNLAKLRIANVAIDTRAAVDRADAKGDSRHKETNELISSAEIKISGEVSRVMEMLAESRGRGAVGKATPFPGIKDAKQKAEDRAKRSLEAFLRPDRDMSTRLEEIVKSTAPGTCEWITKDPGFETWLQSPKSPILWIYGSSGVGKSFLAARLTRYFGKSHLLDKETEVAKVAAYFCDYDGTDTVEDEVLDIEVAINNELARGNSQASDTSFPVLETTAITYSSPEVMNKSVFKMLPVTANATEEEDHVEENFSANLLHTLCWQLAEDDKVYRKYLIDRLDIILERAGNSQPMSLIWETLFTSYFGSLKGPSVVCIIDGLDNVVSSERQILYGFLDLVHQDSESSGSSPVKFIVLSSPSLRVELTEALPSLSFSAISITPQKNRVDIMNFIRDEIQKSSKLSRALKNEKYRTETIEKLADSTGGVFEMSSLLLKQLAQNDHMDLFTTTLKAPPKNIRDILQQSLIHFGETHTAQEILDFNSTLAWVLYSEEYITLPQLNAAIGIESKHGEFLDIREKIETEYSTYFSIVEASKQESPNVLSQSQTDAGAVQSSDGNKVNNEDDSVLDPNEDLATVRIRHASITRFFRNPPSNLDSGKGVVMGMTSGNGHLRLAKTCLQVICATELPEEPWSSGDAADRDKLLVYAAQNMHIHLSQARAAASLQEKLDILQLLNKVFKNDTVIARWTRETSLWPNWYDTSSALGTVWEWYADHEVLDELEPQTRQLVADPNTSIAEKVMKPVAMYLARGWLKDPNVDLNDSAYYFYVILTGLVKLFQRSKDTDKPTPGDHPFSYTRDMGADDIIKVAEWAGIPKTPLWHTRVGYVIVDSAPVLKEELFEHYKTAILIDPTFGQAYYALALGHAEMENKFTLAITEMQRARELKYRDHDAAIKIAEWQAKIAQWRPQIIAGQPQMTESQVFDKILESLDVDMKSYPDDFEMLACYIKIAAKAGHHRDIVSKMALLDNRLPEFLMSDWSSDIHQFLLRAAQKTKRVGFLKKNYGIAVDTGRAKSELLWALATLYAENQEPDEAIKVYEKLIEYADKRDLTYEAAASNEGISILLFLGAWSMGATAEERQSYLDKLIEKERLEEHPNDSGEVSEMGYSYGLQIGLYYRLHGKEEQARPYFKARIERSMFLLDDNDANNDYQALGMLRDTLLKTGDYADAMTAGGIFQQEWKRMEELTMNNQTESGGEGKEETKEESGEGEKKLDSEARTEHTEAIFVRPFIETAVVNAFPKPISVEDGLLTNGHSQTAPPSQNPPAATLYSASQYQYTPYTTGTCDGICDRDMSLYDRGVWFCVYCMDTFFCTDCYDKHQANEIPFIVCDADHEFQYQMGAPEGLAKDEVVVADRLRNKWEWLDEIRARWGLPLRRADASSAVNGNGVAKRSDGDGNGKRG